MWFPSKIDPKQERIIEVGNEDKVPENYIHESPVPKVNYSRDWRKTKIGGQNKNVRVPTDGGTNELEIISMIGRIIEKE